VYRPVFGELGDRMAYVGSINGELQIVIDGVPGLTSLGIVINSIRFSANGQHIAYAAYDAGGRKLVILDDAVVLTSDWITNTSPQFSLDSQHLATGVTTFGSAALVVDDQAGPQYDSIFTGPVAVGRGFEAVAIRDRVFYRVIWEPPVEHVTAIQSNP
jgi:hypothetical protein